MTVATLQRETFTISREMEFFTERELSAQIGLSSSYWITAVLKELIDNALDACENAGKSPEISISLDIDDYGNGVISVKDNANGISADVVNKILDFNTRTSDKEAYRSPSRGAQGNALKTLLAIPFVITGKSSQLVIESQGIKHDIRISVDTIAQKPVINHQQTEIVKKDGSIFTVYTGINLDDYKLEFLQIVRNFSVFSPHCIIQTNGLAESSTIDRPTNPSWQKWTPSDPTSPHWYSQQDFNRLISAYIAKSRDGGRDYTIREFIAQFRGLSSTQRQKFITDKLPSNKRRLTDLVNGSNLDTDIAQLLLSLMQQETKPVPPEALGIIGEEHFKAYLESEVIKYHCYRHKGNIPFVVEAAFGYDNTLSQPEYIIGINFSPTFFDPMSSDSLSIKDKTGWGIKGFAQRFGIEYNDKTRLIVHITHPCLNFQDRGKSKFNASMELRDAVSNSIAIVLKEHYSNRKKADKEAAAVERHHRELVKLEKPYIPSLKEAVFVVMKEAVNKASGNGKFPYSVRQLYYQVRPLIQQYTRKTLEYAYFTPALVTEYEDSFGVLSGLVYDARGHLYEPHTGKEIALGTVDVNNYPIPEYEYDKILYIEKEGFKTILDSVLLGKRYDMAIMTAKGFAVRAAKQLLARANQKEVTVLVAHDCDSYGYEIARTLKEETRTSRIKVRIIDLGLNLADALEMELPSEIVDSKNKISSALWYQLNLDEKAFLSNKRIELNAMTTEQLITWLENKLAENGLATKVIPPGDVLVDAIKTSFDIGLHEHADDAIREAIEKLLMISMFDLKEDLISKLEKPDMNCHRQDLIDYMSNLPDIHWRTWAERRAQKLYIEASKELSDFAYEKVKSLLRTI